MKKEQEQREICGKNCFLMKRSVTRHNRSTLVTKQFLLDGRTTYSATSKSECLVGNLVYLWNAMLIYCLDKMILYFPDIMKSNKITVEFNIIA